MQSQQKYNAFQKISDQVAVRIEKQQADLTSDQMRSQLEGYRKKQEQRRIRLESLLYQVPIIVNRNFGMRCPEKIDVAIRDSIEILPDAEAQKCFGSWTETFRTNFQYIPQEILMKIIMGVSVIYGIGQYIVQNGASFLCTAKNQMLKCLFIVYQYISPIMGSIIQTLGKSVKVAWNWISANNAINIKESRINQ